MLDFPAQEDETLGDRIRNLRIIHGMSQDDLAKAVGVSNRTVSTWERDARMPRMGPIEKMVKLFNVSKPYLMLGQKDEKSPTAVTSEYAAKAARHYAGGCAALHKPVCGKSCAEDRAQCPWAFICRYVLKLFLM